MIYAERIREWAAARNLIEGSTTQAQFVKLAEEMGELAAAIARNQDDEFSDAIGDCFVVLTILAAQRGMEIESCIADAWLQIKDRRGKLVDGVWIKEADAS